MSDSVLVIGGGGREHSLAWKLAQSDSIRMVFVSPGNAGTALHGAKIRNIALDFTNHSTVAAWCRDYGVQLVVIGPEDPLANGLADDLKNEGIMCLGPGKMAAMIESSKEFAKGFMDRHGIPTARWKSFSDPESAKQHILSAPYPALVIKASGLAAGKGVIVAQTKTEACQAVDSILQDKIFGSAGDVVIIEELLTGDEISVLAFSDGENIALMPPAQDHKRLCDGDAGPNTGGMGSVCPYTSVTTAEMETIRKDIMMTTVHGLKREGRPFVGVLFAGIMLTETGPKVLEFNCRFGDPETQVILPILDCDLYPILLACVKGYLKKCTPKWKDGTFAVGVVLASGGYPGSYAKGKEISGLNDVLCQRHLVFHAGTTIKEEDVILTSGGRVLVVVAMGNDLALTIQQAQAAAQLVQFEGKQYRKDIGHRALIKLGREGQGLTYSACGVDITAGDNLVEAIRPMAVTTLRSGVTGTIGGFAGAFDLRAAGYNDPILVSGTDGVGTKLKIAEEVNVHDTIGIDLVAMCVNDILANGAEPLFFLDYFACGKLDVQVAQKVISGIAKGCRLAGCALVGGETAEMPGMYSPGVYDLAGFAVGAVHRDGQLPRVDTIREGDVVIGVASSGLHSNGFSLVRKIVHTQQLNYASPSPFSLGKTLGDELLTPTKIYTKTLLPVIRSGLVKAYAHITGGGIAENIPRVMPASMGAELDAKSWSVPPVFGWLAAAGGIQDSEMLRVFNCGIGAVMIADRQHAESIIRDAQAAGEMAWSIGHVTRITEGEQRVTVVNLREALRNGHGSSFQSNIPTMPSVPIKKVGVLVSGSGTNLQALLDHTLNPSRKSSARIVVVVSNVPGAMGLERAQRANVPTMVINHKDYKSRVAFDMEVHRNLIEAGVEIVCLAGFMRILSGEFVRLWHGKLINIHPALLPSFKGTHAHRQALEAGVRVTGCTVHFVVEEVDAGAILVQEVVAVEVGDTEETLQERVKTVEHVAYPKALELLASGKAALGQDGSVSWM